MTKDRLVLQVPAKKVAQRLPGALAVGEAVLELGAERTADGGSHARRFEARWTKGVAEGTAWVDIRPASKTTTEIKVTIERPTGASGLFWLLASRRRLSKLFAGALAYEVETRSIEEADAFEMRRTSAGLVRARAS